MISMANEIEPIQPEPIEPYRPAPELSASETELASANVVVAAPMSLAGSAQRIWHLTHHGRNAWATAGLMTAASLLITVAWAGVLVWYFTFGLLLVPYRIVRRGQRKQRLGQIRHQEMMNRMWAASENTRR
jgi:hypothetical protein